MESVGTATSWSWFTVASLTWRSASSATSPAEGAGAGAVSVDVEGGSTTAPTGRCRTWRPSTSSTRATASSFLIKPMCTPIQVGAVTPVSFTARVSSIQVQRRSGWASRSLTAAARRSSQGGSAREPVGIRGDAAGASSTDGSDDGGVEVSDGVGAPVRSPARKRSPSTCTTAPSLAASPAYTPRHVGDTTPVSRTAWASSDQIQVRDGSSPSTRHAPATISFQGMPTAGAGTS